MIIDTYTIIIGVVLLLLFIVTPLCSAFSRRPKIEEREGSSSLPSFSIVMTIHDNAYELEHHLPLFLQQHYDGNYEIVLVNDSSSDDTEDILKRLKEEYPHLYTTYIPDSSHYLSRRKLALTVGVKAAKYEWIIFSDIDCYPVSEKWLATIAKYATDDADLLMGYTSYGEETPSYWRYERLQTACYQMRKAVDGTAYRYEGHNLVFRKSVFMEHNGFLANLKYLRGEYDFITNEYATEGRTKIVVEPDAYICQTCPAKKTWTFTHLYYLESRKHMERGVWYRLLFNLDQLMLHMGYLAPIAALVYAVLMENWVLTGMTGIVLLGILLIRIVIFSKTCRAFGESIPLWKAPWLELRTMWQNGLFLLKYQRADKYDFIRK